MRNLIHTFKGQSSVLFVFAGLLILFLSCFNCTPMAWLARALSADQVLSMELLHQLQSSQTLLGIILCIAGVVFIFTGDHISRFVLRVNTIPDCFFYSFFAILAFILALLVQQILFDGVPHVTDATSHCFQAKIFAMGRLSVPAPSCPFHFFQHNVVISPHGLWHSKYFPGQALWLAWGELLGMTWLPMPLSMSLSVVTLGYIAKQCFDRSIARLSTLLYTFSPLMLLLSGSFMSHGTLVMFSLLGIAFLIKALSLDSGGGVRFSLFAVLAGFSSGAAFITRPADCVVIFVAMLLLLWSKNAWPLKTILRCCLWGGVGVLVPIALLVTCNWNWYQTVLSSGYNLGRNPSITPLINDSLGFNGSHSLASAMRSSVWTVLRLNKALFGWPISFLFIPVALMCKEYRRAIFVLLVGISLIGLLYFFWPYYGFEYEARYYSSSAPFLILLTAVGIIAVRGLIMKHGAADSTRRMQANSAIVVLLCCFVVYSLAYYWPIYLYPRYGDAYEGVTTRIDELAEKHHVEDAVILIRCPPHDDFLYSSGFIYNDPLLEASRIYARDLSDDNTCLCEHFPERKIILYNQENEGSPFTRVYPSRVGGENESLKLFKGGH